MTTNALATIETPYVGLQAADDFAALMDDNLGGAEPGLDDLIRVSSPSAGSLLWLVGEDAVKSQDFVGTVLGQRNHRAYWSGPLEDGNRPPDCTSPDGVTGYARKDEDGELVLWADAGGCQSCKTCPFAQWGSGKGNAQACKAMRDLVFLTQGRRFPLIVTLPPTGIQIFHAFAFGLLDRNIPLSSVEIRLGLEKVQSKGGITYSRVKPELVRTLTPDERAAMAQRFGGYRPVRVKELAA